jgi:hypothetical protein
MAPHPFTLSQLAGTLLVQCGTSRPPAYENVISHVERPGAGLVLTGSRALLAADRTLLAADRTLNHLGYAGPVLVEAGRYARAPRVPASAPFTDRWLDRQRALGLPWLVPDAGYVDAGHYRDLETVLSWTRELGNGAIALLALHRSWLNSDGDLPWLVDQVTAAQVPIAVALEHPKDPLGVRYVLEGLIALLAAPVDVLVLRCDVSAVGALCFGATAAAVGTTATLRHLPDGRGRGGSNGAGPSALLRPCLAYKRLSRIQLAVANDPDDPLWQCRCGTCYGLPITALASAADPEAACAAHSVDVLCDLRDELVNERLTEAERRRSWVSKCSHAANECEDLAERFPTGEWSTPPALGHRVTVGGGEVRTARAR